MYACGNQITKHLFLVIQREHLLNLHPKVFDDAPRVLQESLTPDIINT